jgi:hypothetical protein
MGFKSYEVSAVESGGWHLHDGMPVRFSGPMGLVALWCRAHRDAVDRPWRVTPMEWLAMILPPVEARRRWIVFEQEEHGQITYAQLLSVTGVVSRKVDLMYTFAPLVVVRRLPELVVRPTDDGRLWTEELALDGGPHSTTCSWHWTRPHLALGAAIVGAVPAAVRESAVG